MLREHPLRLTASDLSYIDSFEVVHTSNNSYFDDQLPLLKPLVPLVSYDFSRSWEDIERRQHICPWLDIGFLSCSDSDEDSVRTLLEQIHEEGCGIAVATMGSRGAMAWDGREMAYHTPKLVQAVDTLGAGDSFAAGFLMRYLELKIQRGLFQTISEAVHGSGSRAFRPNMYGAWSVWIWGTN